MGLMFHSEMAGAPSLSLDSAKLARDYERDSATRQFEVGKRLVADLGVVPGNRVLDIGCGTGILSYHLANVVGPTGEVVGIDPLPLRIALARTKRQPNLSFRVADVYNLPDLFDATFDVVVMNSVFHWLPEKARPLLECRRVLRPGGRIGIATAMKGSFTRLHQISTKVLSEPPFDRHPRPGPDLTFRVSAEEIRAFFLMTGFVPSLIDMREIERMHPSADAAIRYAEASSFGNFLGHLPPIMHQSARAAIRQRLRPLTTPDGIVQRSKRLFAVAVRQ